MRLSERSRRGWRMETRWVVAGLAMAGAVGCSDLPMPTENTTVIPVATRAMTSVAPPSLSDPCWTNMYVNCQGGLTASDLFDPGLAGYLGGFAWQFNGMTGGSGFGTWSAEGGLMTGMSSTRVGRKQRQTVAGDSGVTAEGSLFYGCRPGTICKVVRAVIGGQFVGCPSSVGLNTYSVTFGIETWVLNRTQIFNNPWGWGIGSYTGRFAGGGKSALATGYFNCSVGWGFASADVLF